MKDYIERAAVPNETQEIYHWAGYESRYDEFVSCEDIRNIPAADVVEVVRCKNCFYYKPFGECNNTGSTVKSDDYCSYGTRMDKEADHGTM